MGKRKAASIVAPFCEQKIEKHLIDAIELQIAATRLSSNVTGKIVWSPAFARARNEEPVVVEAHFEAADFIVSIAMDLFLRLIVLNGSCIRCARRASTLLQILLIGLEILHGRCRSRGRGEFFNIWIEDLGYQQANPARRWQTSAIQIVASRLQATSHFHRLCEIALVRDLDDVAPRALVVFSKYRCGILHFGRAWCGWTFISAGENKKKEQWRFAGFIDHYCVSIRRQIGQHQLLYIIKWRESRVHPCMVISYNQPYHSINTYLFSTIAWEFTITVHIFYSWIRSFEVWFQLPG